MAKANSSTEAVDETAERPEEYNSILGVARKNMLPLTIFSLKIAVVFFVGYMAQFGFFLQPNVFASVVMLAPAVMLVAMLIGFVRNRAVSSDWLKRIIAGLVYLLAFIFVGILVVLGVIQPMMVYGFFMGNYTLGFDYDESGIQMMVRLVVTLSLAALGTYWFTSIVHWIVSKPSADDLSKEVDQNQSKVGRAFQRAGARSERFVRQYDVVSYSLMAIASVGLGLIPAGHSVVTNLGF